MYLKALKGLKSDAFITLANYELLLVPSHVYWHTPHILTVANVQYESGKVCAVCIKKKVCF